MRRQPYPTSTRGRQRGAAALVVSLILLVGMTLVAFFANRGFVFEQRTSANQYRSTRAFEMAEAGLEWAAARFNDDLKLTASPSCVPSSTGTERFADRYLPLSAAGFTIPAAPAQTPQAACSIAANGATTCGCPGSSASPAAGTSTDPGFRIELRPLASDPFAVEVVAWGCTNDAANCGKSASVADGSAVVRALYKMKPTFPGGPGAGLVTGSAAVTGGSLSVVNTDVESNGITINSGTSIDVSSGATSVITLPGSPPKASILDNDPSLNLLSAADVNGDAFFTTFFGETQAEYQNNDKTFLITSDSSKCPSGGRCTVCGTDSACGTAISAAYDKGYQKFWTDTDASFTTSNLPTVGTLGTATRPIMIASSASIELKAAITAYGILYAATAVAGNWDYDGSGNGQIFGALVSRSAFVKSGSGNLTVIYDPNIFKPDNVRGVMVRVPGSWRDSLNEL